jgi:hypothetical protein
MELPPCCRGCEVDVAQDVLMSWPRLDPGWDGLTLGDLRELSRSWGGSSLVLLAQSDALGEESTRRYGDAFRRVLRIDER